jgi:putative MATE family efflux protein
VLQNIPLGLRRNVLVAPFLLLGVNINMKKPVLRSFIKYTSLNIIGMIGISCYILVDTYFIAKVLGATGIASLNLSISIYSIIHGIGLMIGIGGATRFSILRSQRNDKKANTVFSTSIKTGILVGIVLLFIGISTSGYLAMMLGGDALTTPLTTIYLKTILIFAPFFITNNIVLAFVRHDNAPKLSMIAMLVGSFSNIILDYVFMFPLNMGMFGAALATSLAAIISLSVLVFHFINKHNSVKLIRSRITYTTLVDIVSLGLSALVIEVSSAVVLITFNLVILDLRGTIGVAAYGIVANLALVGIAVFTGLAQGTQPLSSKYYGLKNYKVVKLIHRYALVTATAISLIMYLGIVLYANNIIGIFNTQNNLEINSIAKTGLLIYFLGFFFVGINIVTAMFLSSTENPKDAFVITFTRGFIIIIPLVLLLSSVWDMSGVWFSFVISESLVMMIALYFSSKKGKSLANQKLT